MKWVISTMEKDQKMIYATGPLLSDQCANVPSKWTTAEMGLGINSSQVRPLSHRLFWSQLLAEAILEMQNS